MARKAEQEGATERDVAMAAELGQKYVDMLTELETADLEIDQAVTVQTDGVTIRFPDIERVASWITQ